MTAITSTETAARLKATLAKLPTAPGVYLMKDARGTVLYVGRAQNLRNRVRQYWQAGRSQAPLRIETSIDRVADVEYTITDSVSEALLLEATLIKRHQPRFNVRLKDDKSYPYIKVTLADDFPRIERTRKLVNDGCEQARDVAADTLEEVRVVGERFLTLSLHHARSRVRVIHRKARSSPGVTPRTWSRSIAPCIGGSGAASAASTTSGSVAKRSASLRTAERPCW